MSRYFNVREEHNWLIGGPPIDHSDAVEPRTVVPDEPQVEARPEPKPKNRPAPLRIYDPAIVARDPRYIPIPFFHTAQDRDAYELRWNPMLRKWGETFDQWDSRVKRRSA